MNEYQRLIDATSLREEVDRVINWNTNDEYNIYSDVIDMIDDADTIDLVYCKECKFKGKTLIKDEMASICLYKNGVYYTLNDDDFCSRGKRKSKEISI